MAIFGKDRTSTPGPLEQRCRAAWKSLRPYARRLWHPASAIVVCTIAYAALGWLYYDTGNRLQESTDRVVTARRALSRSAPQADLLDQSLRSWQLALRVAELDRASPLPDTDLVRRTLLLADRAGVVVMDAGTRPPVTEEIDGRVYRADPYLLKARGSLTAVETFLGELEMNLVDTLEIRGSIVSADCDGYVLALSAMVYSQPPETGGGDSDTAGDDALDAPSVTATGGMQP